MTEAPGYPRPQLQRADWTCLDGMWEFALDRDARWTDPAEVPWDRTIQVPFSPETPASGIHQTGFYCACWYRRVFEAPALAPGEHLRLHFGAVDYAATVWVNGEVATRHEGGYTPFTADITRLLAPTDHQTVTVRAEDDPRDLAKPRGKQDWQLTPHLIWYPRTTGIWQTVWLERVGATWIDSLRWLPDLDGWEIGLEARLGGLPREGLQLRVRLRAGASLLADDTYSATGGEVTRRIVLADPGIDDYRNQLLWSPRHPTLIHADLELRDAGGATLDEVRSYTALRAVGTQGDRFVLNGRPYPLRLVLDQGYWPQSGPTPPDDGALRRDVELAKAMGFNGVRKHQIVPPPRYLYWADTLGLLVWEEMPSAYRFTKRSVERLTREWLEVIERDYSHPCIVAWVPFNESWGVPSLPAVPAQRHYVQAVYHLTKTVDGERPVVGNDGWESAATDIIGIHDYDDDPRRIARRYETEETIPRLFRRERPGGRLLTLEGHPHAGQPIVLSEFGGIALSADPSATWGYSRASTAEELATKYQALLRVVGGLSLLAGFCYTQFADTYQEANGLLYADRTPKFSLEQMARATRWTAAPRYYQLEQDAEGPAPRA
jgi:beta-galactosidase/beta-glucuronidase